MSDLSQLSDAQLQDQIAQLQGQQSSGNTGTSPLANSSQGWQPGQPYPGGIDVTRRPNGTLVDAKGNVYDASGVDASGTRHAVNQLSARPENLTDAQLQAEINRLTPSPAWDAAQSILPGLAKGGAGLVGLPGDFENLVDSGYDAALKFAGVDPAYLGGLHKDAKAHQILPDPPASSDINKAIQSAFGTYYQPETAWGRGAETVASMAPAGLFPGSIGARLGRVLVPSATSDAAGETARAIAPQYEGAARMAGGVLGGLGQGAAEAVANAPEAALGKAMAGSDPETIDNLQRFLASSKNLPGGGIILTPAEAGAQVGLPQLAKIQHFVENTPQGGVALQPFFAQRPGQVSSVTNALADALAPARTDPSMLGVDAQVAAQGVQIGANAARSAAAKAAGYTAAGPEGVDGKGLADILANIDAQIAGDKTGLLGSRVAKFRGDLTDPEGLAYTDVDSLSRVRNHWRDLIDIPPVGADPLTKEQAGAIGGHLDDLEKLLNSNANYAAGKAAYADASRNLVDPINAGPIGKIAQTADVPTQTGTLFQPRNVGGAAETGQALDELGAQNPDLPAGLVSQYLRNTADGALRNLQGGANEWGGARLGVRMAGSPETREAFLTGVDKAGGDTGQISDYLDALAATGKRLPVGSRTYFNEQMANELGLPDLHKFTTWTDPLTWGNYVNNAVGGALYKSKIASLADFLSSGDTASQGAFLNKAHATKSVNPALASALLAASVGGSHP